MASNPAKGSGVRRKLTEREEDAAITIYELDIITVDQIARAFDVTRQTIYTGINRARDRKGPGSRQRGASDSQALSPADSTTVLEGAL